MIAPHRLPPQEFAPRFPIVDQLVDTVHANESPWQWLHPASPFGSTESITTPTPTPTTATKTLPFAGYRILCIQHQLGTHLAQTDALIRLGARPEHLYFLPPPYTQSRPQFDTTIESVLGVPKENFFHHRYSLRHRYEHYRKQQVLDTLVALLNRFAATPMTSSTSASSSTNGKEVAPLLVLDDGGHFIEGLYSLSQSKDPAHAMARQYYLHSGLRTAVVEQTARGVFKLQDEPHLSSLAHRMNIPIVSVAESKSKKQQEPRYIAQALVTGINHVFTRPQGHKLWAQPPNCRPKYVSL
jgi:hypothetical protein